MSIYRQVVDGNVQVPLPDEPVARAKAFSEVALAWSTMLSSIEHLLPANGGAATLTGGMQSWRSPVLPAQYTVSRPPTPVQALPVTPEPVKSERRGRPAASKNKKRKR